MQLKIKSGNENGELFIQGISLDISQSDIALGIINITPWQYSVLVSAEILVNNVEVGNRKLALARKAIFNRCGGGVGIFDHRIKYAIEYSR